MAEIIVYRAARRASQRFDLQIGTCSPDLESNRQVEGTGGELQRSSVDEAQSEVERRRRERRSGK